jgi:general secretion pathway protein G
MGMAFCRACGHQIHESAISCPQCGALQNPAPLKSQTAAVLLAAFLGGLGIHRFYLGKPISGVFYMLFCWTGIPSLIACVETLVYAFMGREVWATKYNNGRIGDAVPKGLMLVIAAFPVLVCLGIAAAIVVPAVMNKTTQNAAPPLYSQAASTYRPVLSEVFEGRRSQAKVQATGQDIGILMVALKMYWLDNGRYPTTGQGLKALVRLPEEGPIPANWKEGGYIESLPLDPWGNPYQYLSPGIHGEVDVWSLGADGQPGGAGADADIGSWEIQ